MRQAETRQAAVREVMGIFLKENSNNLSAVQYYNSKIWEPGMAVIAKDGTRCNHEMEV